MWNRKVCVRIVEVLITIACVVALRVTDDESRRVFHYLRSRSREWPLLNNVTWGTIGAALATTTCGGYVIITTGLLIAAATGELRGRKTELFLLGLGIILFGIVGSLSMASIDSVPEDLIDNAAVLGTLCLVTALVFIVDLLMKLPGSKKQHGGTQTITDKDATKYSSTTMKSEKELNVGHSNGMASNGIEMREVNGNANEGYEKSEGPSENKVRRDDFERNVRMDRSHDTVDHPHRQPPRPRSTDVYEDERNRKFEDVERQLREYTQNFENGRALRDSQRYRDGDRINRSEARRDFFENDRYYAAEGPRGPYRRQDVYKRPPDEVDTPLFPTNLERDTLEPVFAKIVNPGVKIMRVERDPAENFEDYRYSDSSQYDNVPTRIGKASPGILKSRRDVSFNVPPAPKSYKIDADRRKDELLTSEGTQTEDRRTPSSPTDPGYVRHTASNWPHENKTRNSDSPEHG